MNNLWWLNKKATNDKTTNKKKSLLSNYNHIMHTLWLILPHILIVSHQILGLRRTTKVQEETYKGYYNYADMTDRLQRFFSKVRAYLQPLEHRTVCRGKGALGHENNNESDYGRAGQTEVQVCGQHPRGRGFIEAVVSVSDWVPVDSVWPRCESNRAGEPDWHLYNDQHESWRLWARGGGDCTGSSEGRENAKHYDLDKSFPDRDESFSETSEDLPEVTAVMKWILEKSMFFLLCSFNSLFSLRSY